MRNVLWILAVVVVVAGLSWAGHASQKANHVAVEAASASSLIAEQLIAHELNSHGRLTRSYYRLLRQHAGEQLKSSADAVEPDRPDLGGAIRTAAEAAEKGQRDQV